MILVTGATGFLGSYVARNLLRKGEQVRAIKRSSSTFELLGDSAAKIEWVDADLLDVSSLEDALEGIHKIYHCAGIVANGKKARAGAMAVNLTGAANLYNLALQKGVKKAVHVSSTIALGLPVNGHVIDENYIAPKAKKISGYFESKRLGELEAWRANAEGLEMVIVNPAGIIGAGRWNHEPLSAITAVDRGLSFYPAGSNGFIDVRDAAEVMVRLMDSKVSGERFILISENVTVKEFLNRIAGELNLKPPAYKMNSALKALAWRFEAVSSRITGKAPGFSKEDLDVAVQLFNYNNAKIKNATGYNFKPVAQSIHESVQCYLESKKKGLDYGLFN